MTWFRNSVVIAFTSVLVLFVSTKTVLKADKTSAQDSTPETENPISSRRFKVTVKVAEPEDLKIKEGDRITAGQIIADREREKARLNSQRKQLKLTFQRLSTSTITPPTPPLAVPALAALPPFSYLEHQAAIEKSKTAIASIEAEIDLKKQEIQYLSQLPSIDSIILEHERSKLNSLKRNHTAAVRDYQLAVGKLQSAKNTRAYQKYVASVNAARRVEQLNQTRLNYQRQLAEYEQRLADRQYQIAQVQTRLNEVENALASLSVVKAPYAATVRRVKWLGQSPDGSLSAEITLIVNPTTVSQQQ